MDFLGFHRTPTDAYWPRSAFITISSITEDTVLWFVKRGEKAPPVQPGGRRKSDRRLLNEHLSSAEIGMRAAQKIEASRVCILHARDRKLRARASRRAIRAFGLRPPTTCLRHKTIAALLPSDAQWWRERDRTQSQDNGPFGGARRETRILINSLSI